MDSYQVCFHESIINSVFFEFWVLSFTLKSQRQLWLSRSRLYITPASCTGRRGGAACENAESPSVVCFIPQPLSSAGT